MTVYLARDWFSVAMIDTGDYVVGLIMFRFSRQPPWCTLWAGTHRSNRYAEIKLLSISNAPHGALPGHALAASMIEIKFAAAGGTLMRTHTVKSSYG